MSEPQSKETAVRRQQIAIDGPAGSGKTTVAKGVAAELGYTFVDSGAMYRCVALAALRAGLPLEQAEEIGTLARFLDIGFGKLRGEVQPVWLDGEDVTKTIRSPEVTQFVSPVSTLPAVRVSMVEQQRAIAAAGSVVMEGRDIQTVVLPDADVKVFLLASPEVRAQRRFAELPAGTMTLEQVAASIAERDQRDSTRDIAPLKPADDAVVIDTDQRTVAEVIAQVVELARAGL